MTKEQIIDYIYANRESNILSFEYGYAKYGKYLFGNSNGLKIWIQHPDIGVPDFLIYEFGSVHKNGFVYLKGKWIDDLNNNVFPHFEKLIEEYKVKISKENYQKDLIKAREIKKMLEIFNKLYE